MSEQEQSRQELTSEEVLAQAVPSIEVNDDLDTNETVEEPVVEEVVTEPETPVEAPIEEVEKEEKLEPSEVPSEEEKETEEAPQEEEPQEEEAPQEEAPAEVEEPEVEDVKEELPQEENIEDVKRELEELKAIQKEQEELANFAQKRDTSIKEYNEMCGRLANALQGEFERYGIDTTKSLDDLRKEDPTKAEIAKGLIEQAQRIQEEQKTKVNNELNTAFQDVVFTKAARIMDKFKLTVEQQGIAAETFINIMENSGLKDMAEDLQAKIELAVARAKMIAPAVVKAVEETKEAVEAAKEVVEVVKEAKEMTEVPEEAEPPKGAEEVPEAPKEPEQPKVEPMDVDDFKEGVVEHKDSTPSAALDESNVLQKLASLPHKKRVAFYKENFDLITRASMIAAREHEQRLRNGEAR